jgi:hypothetical protein
MNNGCVEEQSASFEKPDLGMKGHLKPLFIRAKIEFQQNMAVEAKIEDHEDKETKDRRLDCIYDDEPLGFEKDPMSETPKMQAQDPLEEIDIGDGLIKRSTYISANITSSLKEKLVLLLKEFKDCFAWDYNEMSGLSREMVKLKLPIKEGKRPVKQLPRRFDQKSCPKSRKKSKGC